MTPQPSKLRRRWLQFSLRTLFLVMTLWAIWLGWICQRAKEQCEAVAAIEALEGHVVYDCDPPDSADPFRLADYAAWQWPGKAMLRAWLGRDYLDNVIGAWVWTAQPDVDEGLLVNIERLSALRVFGRAGTPISESAMARCKRLRSLDRLFLYNTQISEAGLRHLGTLTSLRYLELREVPLADSALVHLKSLTSLRGLSLLSTDITDAGLAHLAGLTSLKELDLAVNSQITDAGLAHLTHLACLETLDLTRTAVTISGLRQLKCLKSLRRLEVGDPFIDRRRLAELDQLLPNVSVTVWVRQAGQKQ